ncbi:MAG: RsmE family RNA methyltransferase [Chloroflexota bacterium]|nr:RsmE family RNA methyltransferase [Chloroflexota bacterium]
MNRFFLSENQIHGTRVNFPPQIAHQMVHVLRLEEGDPVIVLDDQGYQYRVTISIDFEHKAVSGEIMQKEAVLTEPDTKISLCFGLSNREKVEFILQKGTELGISAFYPYISSRTLVQSVSLSEKRMSRWERIIREAAEQSQRGRLPILNQAMMLETCCDQVIPKHDLSLVAWEEMRPQTNVLHHVIGDTKGRSIALLVGPEGGYSEDEVHLLQKSGAIVISLGKRILRMETAAIVFPAIILHELGEM